MKNYNDIPILDFHAHIPAPNNITQVIDVLFGRWLQTAVSHDIYTKYTSLKTSLQIDSEDRARQSKIDEFRSYNREKGIDSLRVKFENQLVTIPSFTLFLRYVARSLNCQPSIKEIDEFQSKELENPRDYMSKVLERENIWRVVLDLFGETTINNLFPSERAYWVYRIDKMIQPSWLNERGFTTLDQVLDNISLELKMANQKGCVGFKSAMAYNRSIEISKPTKSQASNILKDLLMKTNQPPENTKLYQDFLIKYILKEVGTMNLPFLYHLGVGGPGPRPDLRNLDPDGFRSILDDDDLRETKIVLLHCAYPFEKKAAVMAYQYSNLYIDLSIPTFFHGNLENVLMTYLEFTPHQKIFYGSDAWHTAELFAFDAYFFRKALSNTLQKLSDRYDLSHGENVELAKKVLLDNAKNFLKIKNH